MLPKTLQLKAINFVIYSTASNSSLCTLINESSNIVQKLFASREYKSIKPSMLHTSFAFAELALTVTKSILICLLEIWNDEVHSSIRCSFRLFGNVPCCSFQLGRRWGASPQVKIRKYLYPCYTFPQQEYSASKIVSIKCACHDLVLNLICITFISRFSFRNEKAVEEKRAFVTLGIIAAKKLALNLALTAACNLVSCKSEIWFFEIQKNAQWHLAN